MQEAEEKQRNVIGKRMTAPKAFPRVALDLATTVERIQQNFVICDPNLPDCPIVFASDGFIELTEYPRHEILGRNCRYAADLISAIALIAQAVCMDGKHYGQPDIQQPDSCGVACCRELECCIEHLLTGDHVLSSAERLPAMYYDDSDLPETLPRHTGLISWS